MIFLLDPSKKVVALDGITKVCFKFINTAGYPQ